MAGSFVENVNLLASKLPIIEESNEIFDEGVIPVLEEIALLDLDEAILDLKKGNYLGNRKIDINLALNMQGITQELINKYPEQAEAIWVNPANTVLYNKAIATFVDGTVIELPFLFDGSPVTISTHGDLLAQLTRLDYAYAQAQIDSLYQVTVGDNTDYIINIDNEAYTYTSGVGATRESIIAGIANMINTEAIPITANVTDLGTKLTLTANVAGNPFYAEVSPNMAIATIRPNVIEGPKETEFLAKLSGTLATNFASPVVGELVKIYDIIGQNSNLESLRLHAVSGSYIEETPMYYWAKTTSAFQTLSMRANDIIKLGAEIDNIILLTKSIAEVVEVQKRIPQLVDTFDENGNPNGDETIYNNLSELVEVHSKLSELITVYNDLKIGGTNYVQSIVQNLQGSNTIGVVATDLQLGVDSNINITGSNIDKVITVSDNITNVNTVATANTKIDLIVDTVIPNLPEILLADDNAVIATNKALEATNAAAIATAKSNEIKNVSVGSTITAVPSTPAKVTYNPVTGKFTFVIPKGDKGEKGDAFQVNATGLKASQSLYDSMIEGFSFLAIDESKIYFKMSNTPGDWSLGSPFGKGAKGDKGDTGNSIVNTVFTSTTDPSGLPGQSGATDTYTINYDNLETDTFTVKNGVDGLNTVVDTLEFEVLADDVDYRVSIDTTDGVFEVYFNGMLLPTSNYSLTGSTVIVNKPVVIGDEIIVKKIVSVDVLNTYSQTTINSKVTEAVLQSKNYTDISMATGNAATATKLATARTIGGVSFDGTANINLPGVNITGNQNTTGNAASATKLQTARTINGVSFDGTTNITIADNTKAPLNGAGASGTWGISITGNAETATNASTLNGYSGARYLLQDGWDDIPGKDANLQEDMRVDFTYQNNALFTGPLMNVGVNNYSMQFNGSLVSTNLGYRTKNGDINTWNPWRYIAFTDSDITGNAATATKLSTTRANYKTITDSSVVGELMWKNHGNYHTIFDASNSTNPTGVAINNTNPDYAWVPTYPTLMGCNGTNTYGVRVDSSRYADSATRAQTINNSGSALTFNWSGQGGQPTWLYGGNDPSNAYVYNPSNFSVNYANGAGYAATVAAATSTSTGGIKARLNGTTLYITTNGANA